MNTNSKSARRSPIRQQDQLATAAQTAEMVQQNFDALSAQSPIVEHLTIPGFLRLIDHRWSLEDIRRFGNNVGNMAEAMQLSYMTATDRSLGVLRVFPEPLLRRVYDTLAPQFGWPKIIDIETPELEESKRKRDAIKANERVLKRLKEVITETDAMTDLEALHASEKVLEAQIAKLRAELGEPLASV